MGFRLRLVELGRGAVNVVLQPGHWEVPRVDHLGIALDEEEFEAVIDRAADLGLKIQDHPGKRTFVTTRPATGSRCIRPRLDRRRSRAGDEFRLGEIHLRASDPEEKAVALAEILDLERPRRGLVGDTLVRFSPAAPRADPSSSPR